ncbi:SPOR domain-containing protein [bacterium]|nr:SPOR domain-containing protein [bacterium]
MYHWISGKTSFANRNAIILLLLALLVSGAGCSRQRAVRPSPAAADSRTRDEQVFKTNEEAVKAGIYEPFEDSLAVKGQPPAPQGTEAQPAPAAVAAGESQPQDTAPSGVTMGWRVQVGAFNDQESAEDLAARVRSRAGSSCKVYVRYYAPMWKVHAGDCVTRQEAESLKNNLQRLGYQDAWVVSAGVNR